MYRFLPHADAIEVTTKLPEQDPDVVIFTDNASFERVGPELAYAITQRGIGPLTEKKNPHVTLINIDHHISNDGYGDINLIDPSASACGEIFFHAFKQLHLPISLDVAINIYATIITDTGRFSYGNTNYESFQVASELIRLGVDPFDVVNRVFNTRSVSQIQLLADILNTITLRNELGYFYCYVTQEMLARTGTDLTDTEGALDVLKTVDDFDICIFLKEEPDGNVKVSARSNGTFDVNRLAARFGGGGHPAASGFRIFCTMAEAPGEIERELRGLRAELAAEASGGSAA